MNLRKILCMLLTGAMTLAAAGCSGSGQSSPPQAAPSGGAASAPASSTADAPSASEEAQPEEKTVSYPIAEAEGVTLTYWRPLPPPAAKHYTNYAETEIYQEIMKRTGVNLEFTHPTAGEEKAQFNLMVASGDFPDIVQQMDYYTGGPSASVADGLCIDLTPMLEEYAPDYYRAIRSTDKIYREATDADERVSAFGLIKDRMPPFQRAAIQNAVMDELGIEKIPETIAEYEAAFEKMKAAGIQGICPPKNGYMIMFSRAFDAKNGWHLDKEGKVVFGQLQDGFKEYIDMLHAWYEKGYISPDFMSLSDQDKGALFDQKMLGIFLNPVDLTYTRAKAAGYEFEVLPYPRKELGQALHMEEVSVNNIEGHWTSVTTASKYPEIAVQYLNYGYSEEGAELFNYGIEGLSWNWEGDKRVFTDHMLNNPEIDRAAAQHVLKLHQLPKFSDPDILCNPNVIGDAKALELRMKYSDDTTIDNSMILPPIQLTQEQNAERAKIMSEINTYADEMVLKFITGSAPMSDWDAFKEQIQSMNIDRAREITQQAYDSYMSKAVN
ncbi:MAG: extracellular solute-binding protein [Provencibacterium sp.]|jgi:putative aldouronate transport system substrate-binding protein|nr:extracellular solute-binding protein [Provencibacterium sp.]